MKEYLLTVSCKITCSHSVRGRKRFDHTSPPRVLFGDFVIFSVGANPAGVVRILVALTDGVDGMCEVDEFLPYQDKG